jgi:predicted N-acetyltransferase YhbS
MSAMTRIDNETPEDIAAREALLDRALGSDRFLKPSERLREGRLPAIALVAHDGGRVVGTVRLWHVDAGGRPALLLGPLAVDPAVQGKGVGTALMQAALVRAALAGNKAVILVGDAPYYERFGFTAALTRRLQMPGPVLRKRFLGLELVPNALQGAGGRLVATGEPAMVPAVARAKRGLRVAA